MHIEHTFPLFLIVILVLLYLVVEALLYEFRVRKKMHEDQMNSKYLDAHYTDLEKEIARIDSQLAAKREEK